MGSLGFDLADVRTLLPTTVHIDEVTLEKHLRHGQALHRLSVASKLCGIIESPTTAPRDLIAANQHLREVHAKVSAETGHQELLVLLRETVPSLPAANSDYIEVDDDEEETDEG
jgi:hypothetical protein